MHYHFWPRRILFATLAVLIAPTQGIVADTQQPAAIAIVEASIEQLQAAQTEGRLTAEALVSFYQGRIARYDQSGPALNSIQAMNENALEHARALDAERAAQGPRSLLHGIPILVKDNYETMGMPTTAGSTLFSGFAPERDAYLVMRLKHAGAIILGKTTMHEFAYGITTVGSAFGATKNPYETDRNPGGSSGGTGAAVAANFAAAGMGSDTCGSIRIPSAHNNLVGLRGTQGLSSRRGIVPLSSTQDIGGPLARSVRDLAIILDQTVGFDAGDLQTAESVGRTHDYLASLEPLRDVRIGLLSDWLVQEPADEPVAEVVSGSLQLMVDRTGWQVETVDSPAVNASLDRPLNGHFVLIHDFKTDIEAYLRSNPLLDIADLDELMAGEKYHADIQGSLSASAAMSEDDHATYLHELAQRRHVRRALLALMARHDLDALAYPTIRQVAAPIGEEQFGTNCRLAANSGLPAISVPAGFAEGMPVGLELLAEPWAEQKLLNLAYTVEQTHSQRRLPAATP